MKLLLVEDSEPLRQNMAQHLSDAGFLVEETGDGNEALWCIRENDYALIILDLMLPGKNGIELLREVRNQGKEVSVLIVTARDAIQDRVAGLNAGADDYLIKPFALDELQARVQVLVRRTFGHRDSTIRIGELAIDTLKRCATANSLTLDLTSMEFAILELLAMRKGQVVSRAKMWDQLYDFNSEAESNVVDVLIARLRKKMANAGLPKLIYTRRSEGYLLEQRG